MQTYSHFLMTALAGDRLKMKGVPIDTRAALLGSIMPDMGLLCLTLGYFAYRRWLDPFVDGEHIFGERYDTLYFEDPLWISSHNLCHAPLMIALLSALGYYGMNQQKGWGKALYWFALACGLHTVVDIPTHHNDGPLLLFPLNWKFRVRSPISY